MLYESEFKSVMENEFRKLLFQRGQNRENKQSALCSEVSRRFGFPPGVVSDVVTLRVNMDVTDEQLLFAIASCLIPKQLNRYFSAEKIKAYSQYKYKSETLKFPFTFNSYMVEIEEYKQYIGRTSVKELMKLRDADIINYNTNTQRAMTLKDGVYQITLNKNAVNQISDLLIKRDFIPNTITINLPPETDISYANGKLTINEETKFDILDGYHRYIALSNLYNIDDSFDYPMEIRVLFLNTEDAKQFIYQEAQRTPLAKLDVASMNKNDYGVKICRFVKNRISSDIINPNGIINEQVLIKLIDLLYIDSHKTYEHSKLVSIAGEIAGIIIGTSMEVPTLFDTKWSANFTIMFMGLAKNKGLKGKELYETAVKASEKLAKEEKIEWLTTKHLSKLLES